jgi:hypothetical protein
MPCLHPRNPAEASQARGPAADKERFNWALETLTLREAEWKKGCTSTKFQPRPSSFFTDGHYPCYSTEVVITYLSFPCVFFLISCAENPVMLAVLFLCLTSVSSAMSGMVNLRDTILEEVRLMRSIVDTHRRTLAVMRNIESSENLFVKSTFGDFAKDGAHCLEVYEKFFDEIYEVKQVSTVEAEQMAEGLRGAAFCVSKIFAHLPAVNPAVLKDLEYFPVVLGNLRREWQALLIASEVNKTRVGLAISRAVKKASLDQRVKSASLAKDLNSSLTEILALYEREQARYPHRTEQLSVSMAAVRTFQPVLGKLAFEPESVTDESFGDFVGIQENLVVICETLEKTMERARLGASESFLTELAVFSRSVMKMKIRIRLFLTELLESERTNSTTSTTTREEPEKPVDGGIFSQEDDEEVTAVPAKPSGKKNKKSKKGKGKKGKRNKKKRNTTGEDEAETDSEDEGEDDEDDYEETSTSTETTETSTSTSTVTTETSTTTTTSTSTTTTSTTSLPITEKADWITRVNRSRQNRQTTTTTTTTTRVPILLGGNGRPIVVKKATTSTVAPAARKWNSLVKSENVAGRSKTPGPAIVSEQTMSTSTMTTSTSSTTTTTSTTATTTVPTTTTTTSTTSTTETTSTTTTSPSSTSTTSGSSTTMTTTTTPLPTVPLLIDSALSDDGSQNKFAKTPGNGRPLQNRRNKFRSPQQRDQFTPMSSPYQQSFDQQSMHSPSQGSVYMQPAVIPFSQNLQAYSEQLAQMLGEMSIMAQQAAAVSPNAFVQSAFHSYLHHVHVTMSNIENLRLHSQGLVQIAETVPGYVVPQPSPTYNP